MRLVKSMNLERAAFLGVFALCVWQGYGLFFQRPTPVEIDEPVVPDAVEAPRLEPLEEPPAARAILAAGRDPFTPFALTRMAEKTIEPDRVAQVDPVEPPEDPPRPPPPDDPPDRPVDLDIPPPPGETDEPERISVAALENDPYTLPVNVHGFLAAGATEPTRVLVSPADGGEPFRLGVGDEYREIRVRSVTPESVEFETPDGRIVYVDFDSLLHSSGGEDEDGAAGGGAAELSRRSLFGQDNTAGGADAAGLDGASHRELLEILRRHPEADAIRDAVEKGDIAKVMEFIRTLSPAERKRLKELGAGLQ